MVLVPLETACENHVARWQFEGGPGNGLIVFYQRGHNLILGLGFTFSYTFRYQTADLFGIQINPDFGCSVFRSPVYVNVHL